MRLLLTLSLCLLAASACAGSPAHPTNASAGKGPFASCEEGRCVFNLAGNLEPGATASLGIKPCPYAASCAVNHGQLSAAGLAAARAVRDELSKLELPRSYGCPGCADGPVFQLIVPHANAAPTDHSYDPFVEAEVPVELKNAHALLRAVKDALVQCKASVEVELGECAPMR